MNEKKKIKEKVSVTDKLSLITPLTDPHYASKKKNHKRNVCWTVEPPFFLKMSHHLVRL